MQFLLRVLAMEAAILIILLTAAGRVDLPWCWALVAVHALCVGSYIRVMDPDLRRERLKPGGGEHDRWLRLAILPLVMIHLVVAGLDLRFGWSGTMSPSFHIAGIAIMATAIVFTTWAVRSNRFFSSVVRIQHDRGHHVVTSGPYRLVRHPGYLGMLVGAIGGAIGIGSWWSLLPVLPLVLVLATRAWREECLLRQSLAGYAEYAQSVRFRLLPGVW